jgi:4-aminobutyrate aminotransferase/(S)-3-amino-2-methylpropionate transaminase
MGAHLLDGFERLKTRLPEGSYVCGLGLMCDLEVVKDGRSREPDSELTTQVRKVCQQLGVQA